MLSSSIKNMLKKMGGVENKLHKAQNVMTYKKLLKEFEFDLIICSYASKTKIVGPKYHYLYQQSAAFSPTCTFVIIANSSDEQHVRGAEELEPDCVVHHPFNFNQFKQYIATALVKRGVLAQVDSYIQQGQFNQAIELCNAQSKCKEINWLDFQKVVVDCYIKQNKYESAFLLLRQLCRTAHHRWPFVKMIALHCELGNENKAVELAHEYELLGYPDDPTVSQITAYHSLKDCDLNKAVRVMVKLSIRYPHIVHLTLKCAMLCTVLEDFRKASMFLAKVDYDSILGDDELILIEELKLFLDACMAFKSSNKLDPVAIKSALRAILTVQESEAIDDHKLSKGFYQLFTQVNSFNPVCSPKRLEVLYHQTKHEHRKFMLLAIALNIGCLDLAKGWLKELRQLNQNKKDIASAIGCIVLDRAEEALQQKLRAMNEAKEKASLGSIVDSLAIKAKLAPYFINHHSHFINAMLTYQVVESSDLDLLKEQFPISVGIVIANLLKQDPLHPKVSQIQKAKRIIQKRLQSPVPA